MDETVGHPVRTRILLWWARIVTTYPKRVLGVCLALAAMGVVWTALALEFKSDRSDLVDPSLPWQQRYAEFKESFPRWDDAIVVVRPPSTPDADARVLAFFQRLEAELAGSELVTASTLTIDPTASAPSLLFALPEEEAIARIDALREAALFVTPPTLADSLALIATNSERMTDAQRAGIAQLLDSVRAVAGGEHESLLSLEPGAGDRLMRHGGLVIGFVQLADGQEAAGIPFLRDAIERTRESLDVGVTGIPVLELDETNRATFDAAVASTASFLLIGLLLLIVYRGTLAPILALGALLIGVAWSFAWVTLAVGHLQLLSIVFAIILLGLGVDAAIHIIARLELVHHDHDHMPMAIRTTFIGVGPGIVTGTLTTAAAFAATAFTDFDGVAEMGVIASGGVILTTLAVVSAFPAMLELLRHPERAVRSRLGGAHKPFGGALGRTIEARPLAIVIFAVILVAPLAMLARDVRYDPDLTRLMPTQAEAVRWERALSESSARTSWHAVVVAKDEPGARVLASHLRELEAVEHVGGAGDVLIEPERFDALQRLTVALPTLTESSSGASNAERLRSALDALGSDATIDNETIDRLDGAYQADRSTLGALLASLKSAPSPSLADLEPAQQSLLRARDGGVLLRVYPRVPSGMSPLDPWILEPFVRSVESVATGVTGPAAQILESTALIQRAYRLAALYAGIAIVLLLLIDFRSLFDAACALVPVLGGGLVLLAIMSAFDIPLNFANTIVMPLLIGLGVDSGVHAVHRWRQQPRATPAGLAGGTGRSITLTSVTTALGFACMMFAQHRGIASLGLVMAIGLMTTYLVTITLLPAILRLRTGRAARA